LRGADLLDCGQYFITKDGVLAGKVEHGNGLKGF
jgi:hypothetical protein